jgi:hypothetical protein
MKFKKIQRVSVTIGYVIPCGAFISRQLTTYKLMLTFWKVKSKEN